MHGTFNDFVSLKKWYLIIYIGTKYSQSLIVILSSQYLFMKSKLIAVFIFVFFSSLLKAQSHYNIEWKPVIEQNGISFIWFDGAVMNAQDFHIPSYCGEIENKYNGSFELVNPVFIPLTKEEQRVFNNANNIVPNRVEILQHNTTFGGYGVTKFYLLPVRVNPETNKLEKLISFSLKEIEHNNVEKSTFKTATRVGDTTALASGDWYKIAVNTSGVYKITPQFLTECGFAIANLPVSSVRVLGNGKGVLPEANSKNPNPGLHELKIYMNDVNGDGIFNGSDYALFYAHGAHRWDYNESTEVFSHTYNVYSDKSYYFITTNNGNGKRIDEASYPSGTITYNVNTFDDFQFFEEDKVNLVASGRKWYGDLFDYKLTYNYVMQFANVDVTDSAFLNTKAVARALVANTKMKFKVNNVPVSNLVFPAVYTSSIADYVIERSTRVGFLPTANTLQIEVTYDNALYPAGTAWLDYFAVELRKKLKMNGSSVIFRDKRAYRNGGFAEYLLENATSDIMIWDVTDHHNVRKIAYNLVGTDAKFNAPSDSLRTFAAVKGSAFPTPEKTGKVQNQHLFGLKNVDMVIVSYPDFLVQAEQLAQFHRNSDGLNVFVATPEMIYNEFSSGMQDITGIKLFLRHLYKNSPSNPVKYLLLFGDASYDYKNRLPNMHNFVPIFQSKSSFSLTSSTCTDDYFGFLDDDEGNNMLSENVDIGIGRMPVKSVNEAIVSVSKVINYATEKKSFGDWRNRVLLIADDVDESYELDFVKNVDGLARELDTVQEILNIEKVYIDSYVQEVRAGSQRYPDARQDIFRKVEKGNLITSYLGHGGEVGLAKERILQLPDINGWDNLNNMPLFITVTCEFTRVDDPARVSAGEQLFLNSQGGAIALFSTLRPVYATTNTYNINKELFEYSFSQVNGEYLTLGDIIRITKNNNQSNDKIRFSLIGDPALKLAIPEHKVITDSINGIAVGAFADTLKALSKVRITGHIEDFNGNLLTDFNGIVNPTVYDKKSDKATLRNDNQGAIFNYKTRENIIFKGESSVESGMFAYEFVVPLDISFVIDEGKFSYYATNKVTDAAGVETGILIGGLNLDADFDDEGPEVRVFINDTNFISGGLTDKNPTSIALIADSSGINTVGNGIGHDIVGILDGNTSSPYVLNNYFQSDLNNYQSGRVTFPFFDLEAGTHNLLIRAWDVNNNPGEGEVIFIVDDSHQLALNRVLNYPNPFSNITRFQFEHNRAGDPLQIDIQIFDQKGEMVKRIQQTLVSEGNIVNQITWDGKSDKGSYLSSGVFVYRVIVRSTTDGSSTQDYSKLVFVN